MTEVLLQETMHHPVYKRAAVVIAYAVMRILHEVVFEELMY